MTPKDKKRIGKIEGQWNTYTNGPEEKTDEIALLRDTEDDVPWLVAKVRELDAMLHGTVEDTPPPEDGELESIITREPHML